MIAEGAAVIDVGGESTRPGYETVNDEEEIARVVPIIEKIKSEFPVPVSLDPYKSAVAAAGIQAGADMNNGELWHDAGMTALIAENRVGMLPETCVWKRKDSCGESQPYFGASRVWRNNSKK